MNWSNELEVHQCWISTSIHQDVYASSSASIHSAMKSRVSICILVNVQCTITELCAQNVRNLHNTLSCLLEFGLCS